MKYFCFLLYSRLGNGVPMVIKLVLEIHALCNKNEISKLMLSSQKCNVTNHGFAPFFSEGKMYISYKTNNKVPVLESGAFHIWSESAPAPPPLLTDKSRKFSLF